MSRKALLIAGLLMFVAPLSAAESTESVPRRYAPDP